MGEKMHTFRILAMGELGIFEGDVFSGLALEGSHEAIRSVGRSFLEPVVVIPATSHDKLVEALKAAAASAGFQYMLPEVREKIDAALSRHGEGK